MAILKSICTIECANWTVIGNRGHFGIGVTVVSLQLARKLPRRTSCRYTINKTRGQNIEFPWEKSKRTQWVSATIRVQVWQEMPDLTRPECKADKIISRIVSERQIKAAWEHLLSLFFCENDLTADQLCQPTRTPVHHPHQETELEPNKGDLINVDRHLWGDLAFIIPSMFLSLNWRLASELASLALT